MILILLVALMLAGCKTIADIKPDTIVDIPLHPTEAETQPATEAQTVPATEEQTAPATQPETEPTVSATKPASQNSSSGGKKPGSGKDNSGSKAPTGPKATEPPTQPPTDPPTEPPTEAPTAPPAYDPSGYAPGSRDRGVADAVNVRRQEAGLPPLTLSSRLCAIASVRAWEASRVWSQSRPDGSAGLSVLDEYGYGYSVAAQNLYFGGGSAESIVGQWMNAESRAANILLESATAIGVGSYKDDDGVVYVAALFVG